MFPNQRQSVEDARVPDELKMKLQKKYLPAPAVEVPVGLHRINLGIQASFRELLSIQFRKH